MYKRQPVVNGYEQRPGRKFCATQVSFSDNGASQLLSMHLERAYPSEAGIKELTRKILFLREPKPAVIVTDSFDLEKYSGKFEVTFFTPAFVKKKMRSLLEFTLGRADLLLEYEPSSFQVAIAKKRLTDSLLIKNWGTQLNKITFTLSATSNKGNYRFTFKPAAP